MGAESPRIDPLEPRRLFVALTSGLTLQGSISTPTEVDTHTIDLKAGQTLLVSVGETSTQAFDPTIQLRSPDNKVVRTDAKEIGSFYRVNAAQTGTYKLRISDGGTNDTGTYRITVFGSGHAFNLGEEGGKLASGKRATGTAGPGDLDIWTMQAQAGQYIACSMVESAANSPIATGLTIFDPKGNVVADANNEVGLTQSSLHESTVAGQYVFVAYDRGSDDSGKYNICAASFPGTQSNDDTATSPGLSNNVEAAGDSSRGDLDAFPVYIEEGSAINVTVTRDGGSFNPSLALFNPDGSMITQTDGKTTASIAAPVNISGTHWLLVHDRESDAGGKYRIKYKLSIDNKTPAINERVLHISGTSAADTISLDEGTHNSLPTLHVKLNGKNRYYYRNEIDRIEILSGAGDDSVTADTSIDCYIFGDTGNDTLSGGSGNDTLSGGAGKNQLFGNDGDDRLSGSGGKDSLVGGGGDDRLYGNAGNDTLDGGGNVDRLFGGDGDDVLKGGSSNDKLQGEAGNDTLSGNAGADLLDGGLGTDKRGDTDASDIVLSLEA